MDKSEGALGEAIYITDIYEVYKQQGGQATFLQFLCAYAGQEIVVVK